METTFYIAGAVAVIATILVIMSYNLIHALLYLVVSFLAVAVVFFTLGATFMAALEVIIYAGAIVVLIIFVIMMLNLTYEDVQQERSWMKPSVWIGPSILSFVLLAELVYMVVATEAPQTTGAAIDAKAVGLALYGPYMLGVQLCGILLMAGIVGAYHLGRQKKKVVHRFLERSAAS
ncbi:NADH-quinone oxidoreductase subunit J [Pontibacter qinzhouensis]|uniref:NADH-quinone oxidoreductase subunit J n=1 Tax=Pontibacter qinzhouensis TaxID=2603253 RepID=A0A5C8K4X0_9BACT|nr:NADH-quinone oxidoreductase subunit J [Pontibacter qinzhouensis]TXK44133.1 NADH-quinone oxidoreductase subunit J [Pontibacter qinzhouensis]